MKEFNNFLRNSALIVFYTVLWEVVVVLAYDIILVHPIWDTTIVLGWSTILSECLLN